jgi:hypothetical protein
VENYVIEKLNADQFEVLIPLMKDCFGIDVNIDYFKWKFINNPSGPFIGFIAINNETQEVAAYYGVIPEEYFIEGERQIIFQSCDTMTHSNHRRKGLFQKLAEHCYQYLKENHQLFVMGFGGNQSTPGFLKLGWVKSFDVIYLFIPKLLCYSSIFVKNVTDIRSVEIEDIYHLCNLKKQTAITSFRTIEQFKWRLSNPLHKCNVTSYKNEAYIAHYINENKLFLLDYYFPTNNIGILLINFLKALCLKQNLKGIVTISQKNSINYLDLKRLGFINNSLNYGPLHQKIPFIFLTSTERTKKINNESFWNITPYEHDSL